MRVGFCHCWLFAGGGKSVFLDIIQRTHSTHPIIFTLISYDRFLIVRGRKIPVITALPFWICNIFAFCERTKIPILSFFFDFRNLMPFYPILIWILSWKISRYHLDTLVLSSFAVMKNISFPGKKILYLHSPMQYIWENYDEYTHKLKGFKKRIFVFCTYYLRVRDRKKRVYEFVYSNSEYTQRIAKKIYGLESTVAYPLVNSRFLSYKIMPSHSSHEIPYYIFVGRVVKFVRECDLIIRVFNTLGRRLVIVGDGPDRKELEKGALDNIQFLGHIESIDRKMQLFAAAKGHINLAQESFGLATVESLLCGCPVFGYNYGGSAELVRQNSGLLISSKSEHNIIDKLKEFDTMTFDRVSIQATIRSQIANHPFPDHFL